jgi:glycosyltransferase involved in cell wall biosynthesis
MADYVSPIAIEVIALLTCFVLAWLIQLWILSVNGFRPARRAAREARHLIPETQDQPGVSIVVYAHNQGEQLLENIPQLMESDYPLYEVIVVNDASTDSTQEVLTMFEQRYENFYHTRFTDQVRTVSRKKLAVMLGIKAAHYDIILSTQAHCVPESKTWIASMLRHFTPDIDIVQGPVCYARRTSLPARFYSYDFYQRLLRLISQCAKGAPYAGCGMNLAFRKQLFFDHHAFSRHLNLHPGEDDLFVAEVGQPDRITAACTPEALVVCRERPLRYAWQRLRLSRAFTSRFYQLTPRLAYAVDVATRFLTFLPALGLLMLTWGSWILWSLVLTLLLIHWILRSWSQYSFARRMKMHRYLFSPVLFELVTPFVDLYFQIKAAAQKNSFYVGRI